MSTTTISVRTGAGGTANVSVTELPDGSIALNHVTVNPDGTEVAPAQEGTMQQATAVLQQLATTLQSRIKLDPGTA